VIYFKGFLLVVLATGKGIYCDGEANGEHWGRIADIKKALADRPNKEE
jgi:hypothetical protein